MDSRRSFVSNCLAVALPLTPARKTPLSPVRPPVESEIASLNGEWLFQIDPDQLGESEHWQSVETSAGAWRTVVVPHTWQIEAPFSGYRGFAWYRKTFEAHADWQLKTIRLEFEAVFHSTKVWVNGKFAGEHTRKGYTAFAIDITPFLAYRGTNTVAVRVNNSFDEHMLPRGRSSDWAHDGGVYRPVQLIVSPPVFIDRIDVDALPDAAGQSASLAIVAFVHNASTAAQTVKLSLRVMEEATGLVALAQDFGEALPIAPNSQTQAHAAATLPQPKLWHFDSPHLYRLEVTSQSDAHSHLSSTVFGVRRFEVRGTAFYLNGEKVRLMGVERMAGSNPEFGMAEPEHWIEHDHRNLKHLNCVFTRVHWPQDERVLDYCDRHGILMQTEVPTWGPNTFASMGEQPDVDIMQNGLDQLREMVARDRNHPCIGSWGLCNEIGGQNPAAYNFAKTMLAEAKRIDPNRLCSYASHSLFTTPAKDVSGLMDFVSCNEYFGSWQPGGPADLEKMIENVHAAFPDKPIVISEYGYCACTADRPEGDEHREYVMRSQDEVFRQRDYIAGLIFFCYNDYRTHVGDRGAGVLQQRVHGVVDLFGARKPSYQLLRQESSPIDRLVIKGNPKKFQIAVQSRANVPGYTLRGYKIRGVLYGFGNIPVEQQERALPDLPPGENSVLEMLFSDSTPLWIEFDVIRPTGFSAFSQIWRA